MFVLTSFSFVYLHIVKKCYNRLTEQCIAVSVDKIKINVGRDFQATDPELQPESQRKPELLADRALLVWSPTDSIPDSKCK